MTPNTLGELSDTVKVAVAAVSFTATLPMLRLGGPSLSSTVARPLASVTWAPEALPRLTVKLSVPSYQASSSRFTVTVWLVTPGAKLSVPDLGV